MTKNSCVDCIYEEDRKEINAKGYIMWGSSKPHPCINCERAIHNFPDNYIKKPADSMKGIG